MKRTDSLRLLLPRGLLPTCLFRTALFVVSVLCMLSTACTGPGEFVPDCQIDRGPCRTQVADREVELDISPKPVRAMEELLFVVTVKDGQYGQLLLDLSMPGMRMGGNQVVLTRGEDGLYAGKGVIPRCPSGRRLWEAAVGLPGAGAARFRFNVTY